MKHPPAIILFVWFVVAGCLLWQLFSLVRYPCYLAGGGFRAPLLFTSIATAIWFLFLIQRHPVSRYLAAATVPVVALCWYIVYNSLVRWQKLTLLQYAVEYSPVLAATIFAAWYILKDNEVRTYYCCGSKSMVTGKADMFLKPFSHLFAWLVFLLAYWFVLPEITLKPFAAMVWLLVAAIIGIAHLTPLAVIARHKTMRKIVAIVQAASIALVLCFFHYGFNRLAKNNVVVLKSHDAGGARVWFSMLSALMLIGATCGLIRTIRCKANVEGSDSCPSESTR